PAMTTGPGIYFDGRTSARHDVRVTLGASGLKLESSEGTLLADWPYDEIDELSAPETVLRLGRRGNAALERPEVLDPAFAAAIDAQAIHVDRTGMLRRRQRRSVIGWSVAATVSLVLVAYFGVPAIAGRLTLLVPPALERKLGDAVDVQTRAMLDTRNAGPGFECGTAASEKAGRAALDRLIRRLEAAAGMPVPLSVTVVRRNEP